jgi:hypothetical protein
MSLTARLAEAVAEANLLKSRIVSEQAEQVVAAARVPGGTPCKGAAKSSFSGMAAAPPTPSTWPPSLSIVSRSSALPWRPWPSPRTPLCSPASPTTMTFRRCSPSRSGPWGVRGTRPGAQHQRPFRQRGPGSGGGPAAGPCDPGLKRRRGGAGGPGRGSGHCGALPQHPPHPGSAYHHRPCAL